MSQPTLDPFASLQGALEPQYRLERELGRGGMGVVFLATDTTLDRRVAIKVVHPELAAHQSIARRFSPRPHHRPVRHPNIVAVHTAGTADGLLYYVMDEVEGESLRQRLAREGRLDPAEAGRIVADVAAALDAARARRVVHRDVKPENVLLDRHTGRALLADFGIARAMVAEGGVSTGQGVAVGTPAYMSPEQAAGEEVDRRSDLYALGIVGYEMLAGHPPSRGPIAWWSPSTSPSGPPRSIGRVRPAPSAGGGDHEGAGKAARRALAERRGAAAGPGRRTSPPLRAGGIAPSSPRPWPPGSYSSARGWGWPAAVTARRSG